MDTILVVNAGSSSLKFEVFAVGTALMKLVKGQVEGIGTAPHFTVKKELCIWGGSRPCRGHASCRNVVTRTT
jgi:Acetokinase family